MSNEYAYQREYIGLGHFPKAVPCLVYHPEGSGEKKRIAMILCHSDDDYFEFLPAPEMAKRGYTVIATHVSNPSDPLDQKIREIGMVMDYARASGEYDKVLLLGHSGGATLMSAYENIAENGVQTFQGKERIIPLDDIGALKQADGVMFMDANFGNGIMSLISLDPAVTDEATGMKRDPALDIFNPANGYAEDGSTYSEAFLKTFWKAQAERMNRLIDFCRERVALIDTGKGRFVNDEPLCIPGGTQFGPNNKLIQQCPQFFSHTKEAQKLIHHDGSVTEEIVPCLRKAHPGMNSAAVLGFGALQTTVKTFLKSSAIRVDPDTYGFTETDLNGVDVRSSYCVTIGNVDSISAPILALGMTGSYEYIASEFIGRNAVKCQDKTIGFVEAAGHNFTLNEECEETKGQYGDPAKACFDFADKWIEERYL